MAAAMPVSFDGVSRWVAPDHLRPEALAAARQAFAATGAVTVDDFLRPEVATGAARFLAGSAAYRRLYGLVDDRPRRSGHAGRSVSEDEWHAAPVNQRAFRLWALEPTLDADAGFDLDRLWFAELSRVVCSPGFGDWLLALTGRDPGSGTEVGAHQLEPGDWVGAHDDARHGRELAVVVFLTPDWDPSYGGALRVRHPDGAVTVDARYNRFAAFDTSVVHSVDAVTERAGSLRRRTLVAWRSRG